MRQSLATLLAIAGLSLLGLNSSLAAGGGVQLLDAKVNLEDRPSLQRGAQIFVNYCLSCHGASFMRYKRMGDDLGLSDAMVESNLMFATDKIREKMEVAIDPQDAEKWFGVLPPDLSVIARARGADWLYTYLLAFYQDDNPARPFGVNNLVFKDVSMPHAMVSLQGVQKLRPDANEVMAQIAAMHGTPSLNQLLMLEQGGDMNQGEYRKAVRDLVSFLVYLGEPAKLVRYGVGLWVFVFLLVLFWLTRLLYKEYWKDIH